MTEAASALVEPVTALVTGGGQVAFELQRTAPAHVKVVNWPRAELDITDAAQVQARIGALRPQIIINAAAYTAVDKAESESDKAYAVNATGAGNLAQAAAAVGARLVHISTDFVFDGSKGSPYGGADKPNPLSVYGASKLAGEQAVLAALPGALVVRTAWVYSSHGGNFVKTMLRLMAEKPALNVVGDQVGTPTWAKGLATALWAGAERGQLAGIFNWTDAGVASWYDFAVAIQKLAWHKGLLERQIPVRPIATHQYPTPARRPSFSLLDKAPFEAAIEIATEHWQAQLSAMLDELKTD